MQGLHTQCANEKTKCYKSRADKFADNKNSDNVAMQKKISHAQVQLDKNKADAKQRLEKAK